MNALSRSAIHLQNADIGLSTHPCFTETISEMVNTNITECIASTLAHIHLHICITAI